MKFINFFLIYLTLLFIMMTNIYGEENEDIIENEDELGRAPIVKYGIELDFVSKYVVYGFPISKGPVMQTSIWGSIYNITLTVWNNLALSDDDLPSNYSFSDRLNEYDIILSYEKEIFNLYISPSLTLYIYPDIEEKEPETGEFSLELSYPISFIDIFTTQVFDYWKNIGAYTGNLGLSYQVEFADKFKFDSSLSIRWGSSKFNKLYDGPSKWAINSLTVDLGLNCDLTDYFYIYPHISFNSIIDDKIRDTLKEDLDIFYGGVSIGLAF